MAALLAPPYGAMDSGTANDSEDTQTHRTYIVSKYFRIIAQQSLLFETGMPDKDNTDPLNFMSKNLNKVVLSHPNFHPHILFFQK